MEELYEALTQSKDLQLTAAILADEPTKVREIWKLRETIAEGIKSQKDSACYKYQYMYEIRRGEKRVGTGTFFPAGGHSVFAVLFFSLSFRKRSRKRH